MGVALRVRRADRFVPATSPGGMSAIIVQTEEGVAHIDIQSLDRAKSLRLGKAVAGS